MNYPFKVGGKKAVLTLSNAVSFTGLTLPTKICRRHLVPVVAGQCLSQSRSFTGYSSELYRDWSSPAFWICEHSQDLREKFSELWRLPVTLKHLYKHLYKIKCVWRWQTFESVCGYDQTWHTRCRVLYVTVVNVRKEEFPSRKDLKVIGQVFCLSYSKPANRNSSVMPVTGSFSPFYNLNPAHRGSYGRGSLKEADWSSESYFLSLADWIVRIFQHCVITCLGYTFVRQNSGTMSHYICVLCI